MGKSLTLFLSALALVCAPTFADDNFALLTRLSSAASSSEAVTLQMRDGADSLWIRGKVVFVGAPKMPDLVGIKDQNQVLHLIRADSRIVSLQDAEPQGAEAKASINVALKDRSYFWRIHANRSQSDAFLRENGFGAVVDTDIRKFSNLFEENFKYLWVSAPGGIMVYLFFLDSAGPLYLGELGPRFITNHFSSFIGSLGLGTMLSVFVQPFNSAKSVIWRALIASTLTYGHYVLENPFGVTDLAAPASYNVKDPIDFWVGTTAAWATTFLYELSKAADVVNGKLRNFVRTQRLKCESLLTR